MRRLVLACLFTACGGSIDGGGDDDTPPADSPPVDPPIPAGCVDDVATGDHVYQCADLKVDARIPAACQGPGCGLILVLHGDTDDLVPNFDARVIADAHGDAELRIISGGGHELRHDPRAVAVLLGWLARQHDGDPLVRYLPPA